MTWHCIALHYNHSCLGYPQPQGNPNKKPQEATAQRSQNGSLFLTQFLSQTSSQMEKWVWHHQHGRMLISDVLSQLTFHALHALHAWPAWHAWNALHELHTLHTLHAQPTLNTLHTLPTLNTLHTLPTVHTLHTLQTLHALHALHAFQALLHDITFIRYIPYMPYMPYIPYRTWVQYLGVTLGGQAGSYSTPAVKGMS